MLDKLHHRLKSAEEDVAFCYASFAFKGTINKEFPADPYNIQRLMENNYISSNSLLKAEVVFNIGLVTDNYYKRLLDWCLWLKLFFNGFRGIPCPEASFIAVSTQNDISSRSAEDFKIKKDRVLRDFVAPIIR